MKGWFHMDRTCKYCGRIFDVNSEYEITDKEIEEYESNEPTEMYKLDICYECVFKGLFHV